MEKEYRYNIVDIVRKEIFFGKLLVCDGVVMDVFKLSDEVNKEVCFLLPGFVDSHIHIESSMLTPLEFSKIAVKHGTVATVSDPHEIANILGVGGVKYMVDDAEKSLLKMFFGIPSCVPATEFETSGFEITVDDVSVLIEEYGLKYLSEMMNYPGVILGDEKVLAKIDAAKKYGLPIDGHAPALKGGGVKKYAEAGITTDHESFTLDEAVEKIKLGIKLQIREGSAAKNFEALYSAIEMYPDEVMLCSDDLHPDDLLEGHVNKLVVRCLKKRINLFDVLKTVTVNPVKHYNLEVGLLQKGDNADFIVVDNLTDFNILKTVVNGREVYSDGNVIEVKGKSEIVNNFNCDFITQDSLKVHDQSKNINVIEVIDGELITKKKIVSPKVDGGFLVSDIQNDILKVVVVNRYLKNANPVVGFISGFGFKKGAFASSIAHDSHNIIAVGCSDFEIVKVVNELISLKGGIVLSDEKELFSLQLNVAGLMSNKNGIEIALNYKELNKKASEIGCVLKAPFMTLSFMALLVIPELKIGDKFLFDVNNFKPISLFVD